MTDERAQRAHVSKDAHGRTPLPSGGGTSRPPRPGERWADEPTAAERALYLTAVRHGGHLRPDDLAPADRPTLAVLVARGLLAPTATGYTAVDPRSVGDRLGTELRTRATRLLVHAERLPAALGPLSHAYDAAPRAASPTGEAAYVEGQDAIRLRLSRVLSECGEEVLTAQPGTRQPVTLELALHQDVALLTSGRRIRTLYQPVARRQPHVIAYAKEVTRHGSLVRILNEPFQRMLVVDRRTAVVSVHPGHDVAAFITEPAAVAALVAVFERDWARADVTDWSSAAPGRTADRVTTLLSKGLTQRAVATRLGLSERTVAGHLARLRERYGARTLFQLGWQLKGDADG
ncbi:LuxR family transcriptional regulator [Kitasatospora sp. NPDC057936]|uniref:LuxR family transcriptional regulator n=1 Tax=Kitasatospora sp. NPDC057936 TaxID=3346283 RepID=UPI0036D7FA37